MITWKDESLTQAMMPMMIMKNHGRQLRVVCKMGTLQINYTHGFQNAYFDHLGDT